MPGVDLRNYSFQQWIQIVSYTPCNLCMYIYIYICDWQAWQETTAGTPPRESVLSTFLKWIHSQKNNFKNTNFFLSFRVINLRFTSLYCILIGDYHGISQSAENPTIHQPFTNHSWPLDSRRSLMATLILDSDEEDVVIIAERFLPPARLRTNGSGGWHGSGRALVM